MTKWREIQRRITSLQTSTCFTVVYKDFGMSVKGINSSYVSHSSIEFINGHHVDINDLMIFVNERVYIVVAPYLWVFGALDDGYIVEKIPSIFLKGLMRVQGQLPLKEKTVAVFFEDLFTGYDADGKPMYKEGRGLDEIIQILKFEYNNNRETY